MKEDAAEIKSSLRLDRCHGTAERVPLCLTLKVFDLQQGDPAAGSSKNTSPSHVGLCSLLLRRISAHITMRSLLSLYQTSAAAPAGPPAAQNVKSKDPRRDLRALGGAGGPFRETNSI